MAIKNIGLQIRHDAAPQLLLQSGIGASQRTGVVHLDTAGRLSLINQTNNTIRVQAERPTLVLESTNLTAVRDVTLRGYGALVGGVQSVFRIEGENATPIRIRTATLDRFEFGADGGLGVLTPVGAAPQIYALGERRTGIHFDSASLRLKVGKNTKKGLTVEEEVIKFDTITFQVDAQDVEFFGETLRFNTTFYLNQNALISRKKILVEGLGTTEPDVANLQDPTSGIAMYFGGGVSTVELIVKSEPLVVIEKEGVAKKRIGFFGATPVPQVSKQHMTLADVVQSLKDFGLYSSTATARPTVRQLEWDAPGTVADGAQLGILRNIPAGDDIWRIVIRDKNPAGSIYEFEVTTSLGSEPRITPLNVLPANSHFKRIFAGLSGGGPVSHVAVICKASASGQSFEVEIDSPFPDLISQIEVDDVSRSNIGNYFEADLEYPGTELVDFLRAKSGDASATVPVDKEPGENLLNFFIDVPEGTYHQTTGLLTRVGDGKGLVRLVKPNSDPIPHGTLSYISRSSLNKVPGNGSTSEWTVAQIEISDPGFMGSSKQDMKGGTYARWTLRVDRRDPVITIVEWDIEYTGTSGQQFQDQYIAYLDKVAFGADIGRFYYSHFSGQDVKWYGFTE